MATNFWTSAVMKDPKRKFRFVVSLLGYGNGAAKWYAKTVTKPKFSITETAHSYLNHKFYYPGRTEWQTVDVTLVDPLQPDAMATTMAIIQAAGYHPPRNADDMSTMSKQRATSALQGVVIEQLDSDGNAVETWTLKNAFITNVDTQDLSYEADELSEISLTIRYDWAVLTGYGGGEYFATA